MNTGAEFGKIRAQTQNVYERSAEQFDRDRARDGREDIWLERFTENLLEGAHILDLGCGSGEPIAAWLLGHGYRVTGVDYSEPMLKIARERLPGAAWVLNDMRDLTIDGAFDGIISWHGSFHLSQDEQRKLIPKLAKLLNPGGALMMTIGPEDGEVTGTIGGETVYHASLHPDEYRARLEALGFTEITLENSLDDGGPFVLLARK